MSWLTQAHYQCSVCGGWHIGHLRLLRRGYDSQPNKNALCFSLLDVPDAVEQVKHVLQHCFVRHLHAQRRWNIAGNKVEQRIGLAFHLFHLTISEGGTGSSLVK